jgi:hypothetical protein
MQRGDFGPPFEGDIMFKKITILIATLIISCSKNINQPDEFNGILIKENCPACVFNYMQMDPYFSNKVLVYFGDSSLSTFPGDTVEVGSFFIGSELKVKFTKIKQYDRHKVLSPDSTYIILNEGLNELTINNFEEM